MSNKETGIAGIHDIALIMRDEFGAVVKESEQNIRNILKAVSIALKNNDSVHFKGFLKINKKIKPPRKGRNPKTGEEIMIDGYIGLSYKTGSNLKEFLNS